MILVQRLIGVDTTRNPTVYFHIHSPSAHIVMSMDTSCRPAPPLNLHEVSHDQKWELLKPILEYLYIHKNKKIPEIDRIMRADYDFQAQYAPDNFPISLLYLQIEGIC
jgi:hypothetical protein